MPILLVWIMVAPIALLQLGDWWTTNRAIVSGVGHEANPVMVWLINRVGLAPAFLIKGIAIVCLAFALAVWAAQPAALIGNGTIFAVYAVVVWRNWRLIK